jgi:hypothetical protein
MFGQSPFALLLISFTSFVVAQVADGPRVTVTDVAQVLL